jgi:hypothetical protein
MPTQDKILIDLSKDWPNADTADALASNPSNCTVSGQWPQGIGAAGAAEGCNSILPINLGDQTTDGLIDWDSTEEVIEVGDDGTGTHKFYPGAHTTDASDLSSGTIPVDRVGAAHIDDTTEIKLCIDEGYDSIPEFDDTTGEMTCKKSTQTTISGEVTAADFLVYKAGSFQDVEMSGDAEMDEDGVVTLDPAINFATTGTITGNINVVLDATTSDSPTGTDLRGSMLVYSNAGVVTITLPDVDTVGLGASACFYDGDATAILTIDLDGDDKFLLDDTLLDAGDTIDSPGDLGDFICIMAIDADTTWATLGRRGTWVDDGPL